MLERGKEGKMISQKELIHKKDWDILLVFDACRYDFFEKYYRVWLPKGKLLKCESSTTFTFGWIMNSFGKDFDATFVSTEPIKDSIHDITNKMKHGNSIDVRQYFKKVVDVYTGYWVEPGLIYPEPVFDTVEDLILKGERRVVAKFIQIHDPYVYSLKKGLYGINYRQIIKGNFRKLLYEVISDELYWTILKKLNLPPENWLNYLWLEKGREGIVEGYCNDLIMMMQKSKKLMEKYPEFKFVITTDHGERLGEGGRYSHGGRRNKIIKEIPWFEVENGR